MLNTQVTFYIPSTQDINNNTSAQEFNNRALEVAGKFGQWFGGFTITDGIGGWVADDGELVTEQVKKVTSYTTPEQAKTLDIELQSLATAKRIEWQQEAISLEIVHVQGGLDFI